MTETERISLEFQAPDPGLYRRPEELTSYLVCPHCKEEVASYVVACDGHTFEVDRCAHHGDVVPIRSHVRNEATP